jgi:ubiquinone/menaquinone biosynthesis C-methylase UbiE
LKITTNGPVSSDLINRRRRFSCYKFSFLEFLASKIELFDKLLISWRKTIYLKEIRLAKILSNQKVLLIGSGIIPHEAVFIAEETKAKVVGIDNNSITLKFAKSYVNKKGLSNYIRIEYGDGLNYPIRDFDVIFIAINVSPIDLILEHIYTHMKDDAKILCKSFRDDLKDVLNWENLCDKFLIKSVLKNPKSKSFLLVKK